MAKFAITLCILLVACGAQGAWTDDVMNEIKSTVEYFMEQVESYTSSLRNRYGEAMSNADNFAELVNSTMKRAKDEWEAARKELSTLSEDPEVVRKCMAEMDASGDMADEIKSSVNKCISGGMSDVTNHYESTKAAIGNYTDYLANVTPRATKCWSNLWTLATCLGSIALEMTEKAVQTWNEVRENDEKFIHDFFSFEATTTSCNFMTSLQNMVKEKQEEFAKTDRCIADANSASGSASVS